VLYAGAVKEKNRESVCVCEIKESQCESALKRQTRAEQLLANGKQIDKEPKRGNKT